MRKISAWVAIAAVPTALAGIYGMNFQHMPELDWQYGYSMALADGLIVPSVFASSAVPAGSSQVAGASAS